MHMEEGCVKIFEKRYSEKWNLNMLADYCWILIRETPTSEKKGQKKAK